MSVKLGNEGHDLLHAEASSTETNADIVALIRKIASTSITNIEKLIGELQETRTFLESERERVQQEAARYIKLTQMASASVRIISDTVSGWRQAGYPMREFAFTRSPASPADDSTVAWPAPSIKDRASPHGAPLLRLRAAHYHAAAEERRFASQQKLRADVADGSNSVL
jgi:hypothetical protein